MWRGHWKRHQAAEQKVGEEYRGEGQVTWEAGDQEQAGVLQNQGRLLEILVWNSQGFRVIHIDIIRMKALKEDCEKAYKQALKMIENPLVKDSLKTDALKLGICLNFAVFYY